MGVSCFRDFTRGGANRFDGIARIAFAVAADSLYNRRSPRSPSNFHVDTPLARYTHGPSSSQCSSQPSPVARACKRTGALRGR
jgi:hypothetical protein